MRRCPTCGKLKSKLCSDAQLWEIDDERKKLERGYELKLAELDRRERAILGLKERREEVRVLLDKI